MPHHVTDDPPKLLKPNKFAYRKYISQLPLGNWPKAQFRARLWPVHWAVRYLINRCRTVFRELLFYGIS